MTYAVIRTGGKQYRVSLGDIVHIEKLQAQPGSEIVFDDVLMTALDGAVRIGTPQVSGARVTAKVLRQRRDKKILVFKKRRRKNYRRRRGHRQYLTTVQVTAIA